jgi:hypothetical protein
MKRKLLTNDSDLACLTTFLNQRGVKNLDERRVTKAFMSMRASATRAPTHGGDSLTCAQDQHSILTPASGLGSASQHLVGMWKQVKIQKHGMECVQRILALLIHHEHYLISEATTEEETSQLEKLFDQNYGIKSGPLPKFARGLYRSIEVSGLGIISCSKRKTVRCV